jgi:hypothetical protein
MSVISECEISADDAELGQDRAMKTGEQIRPALSDVTSASVRQAEELDDQTLWQQAHDEAIGLGTGLDQARWYADKTVLYARQKRAGTFDKPDRNIQAFR